MFEPSLLFLCYDMLLKEDSMTQEDRRIFYYNTFHGNDEKNITSQINLLSKGVGQHKYIFDPELSHRNMQDSSDGNDRILILKQ